MKLLDSEWGKTAVVAGGTDLISLMKDLSDRTDLANRVATPTRLVSLKQIAELKGIEFSASKGLRIGSMAARDSEQAALSTGTIVANQLPVTLPYPTRRLALSTAT